jgi:hypothetical protein
VRSWISLEMSLDLSRTLWINGNSLPRISVSRQSSMKHSAARMTGSEWLSAVKMLLNEGTGTSYWARMILVGTPWAMLDLVEMSDGLARTELSGQGGGDRSF